MDHYQLHQCCRSVNGKCVTEFIRSSYIYCNHTISLTDVCIYIYYKHFLLCDNVLTTCTLTLVFSCCCNNFLNAITRLNSGPYFLSVARSRQKMIMQTKMYGINVTTIMVPTMFSRMTVPNNMRRMHLTKSVAPARLTKFVRQKRLKELVETSTQICSC